MNNSVFFFVNVSLFSSFKTVGICWNFLGQAIGFFEQFQLLQCSLFSAFALPKISALNFVKLKPIAKHANQWIKLIWGYSVCLKKSNQKKKKKKKKKKNLKPLKMKVDGKAQFCHEWVNYRTWHFVIWSLKCPFIVAHHPDHSCHQQYPNIDTDNDQHLVTIGWLPGLL